MKIFDTDKKENLETYLKRFFFNFFPAYRRTGARIAFISSDWKEMHVKLPFSYKTRNYVGSTFGGSIYASVDPIYMMQLICILSRDYVIWDKAAEIKFKRPAKTDIKARFVITDQLIAEIIEKVRVEKKYVFDLPVTYVDSEGIIYAEINKTLYVADKAYYNNIQKEKSAKKL